MVYPTEIKTSRLFLEKINTNQETIRNVNTLCSGNDAEQMLKYTSWESHDNLMETENFIRDELEKWDNRERATYTIERKTDDQLIGICRLITEWENGNGTLGCLLTPDAWGEEYSKERALALIEIAFDELDLSVVSVWTANENKKAERAIERYIDLVGGKCTGYMTENPDRGYQVSELVRWNHYEVLQSEYEDKDVDSEIELISYQ